MNERELLIFIKGLLQVEGEVPNSTKVVILEAIDKNLDASSDSNFFTELTDKVFR